MHLQEPERRRWIADRLEAPAAKSINKKS